MRSCEARAVAWPGGAEAPLAVAGGNAPMLTTRARSALSRTARRRAGLGIRSSVDGRREELCHRPADARSKSPTGRRRCVTRHRFVAFLLGEGLRGGAGDGRIDDVQAGGSG